MSSRQHIKSYLDYYLKTDVATDFAVAIAGAWGSGKTTFIRKYLDLKKKDYVYVSLNGLTSVSQIESEIFAQLHPIRNSKTARVARKVLAGSLKASLKIDIDGDGDSDGTVGVGITPEALEKFADKSDSYVYVFDDVERSEFGGNSIQVALGYVNQLTEHLGIKAIVLWNEEKLPEGSGKIAEKTIGQSFTLEANAELALKDFIEELSCSTKIKNVIKRNEREILQRFSETGVDNLRSLRQAIMDCERILECFDEDHLENGKLVGGVIRHAIILKIDQRAGRLKRGDLSRDAVAYLLEAADKEVDDKLNKSWEKGFQKRHAGLSVYDLTLSRKTWERIIFDGYIDRDQLAKEATPFVAEQEPQKTWRELWPFEELNQTQFEKHTKELISRFQSEAHGWEVMDFLQSLGILIDLAKHELIEMTLHKVREIALSNIKKMAKKPNLKPVHVSSEVDLERYIEQHHLLNFDDSSEGKAVRCRHSDDYKEIRLELFKKQREAGVLVEKEKSSKLLKEIDSNFSLALKRLAPNMGRREDWYNYAVLRHLDPKDLIGRLENNKGQDVILGFGRRLSTRYKQGDDVLIDELDWLNKFHGEIEAHCAQSDRKLSVYQWKLLKSKMLEDSIELLGKKREQIEEKLKPFSQ